MVLPDKDIPRNAWAGRWRCRYRRRIPHGKQWITLAPSSSVARHVRSRARHVAGSLMEGLVGRLTRRIMRQPSFSLHYEREPLVMEGGTTFYFVTGGIEEALKLAKQAAGDKDVKIGRRCFHCTTVSTSWADRFSAFRAFSSRTRSRRSVVRRSRPACTWIFSDRANSYGTRDPFRTGESLRTEIVNEAQRLVSRKRLVGSDLRA